jgi:hypothetical protein
MIWALRSFKTVVSIILRLLPLEDIMFPADDGGDLFYIYSFEHFVHLV